MTGGDRREWEGGGVFSARGMLEKILCCDRRGEKGVGSGVFSTHGALEKYIVL